MKITIDTKEDSPEDIRKVAKLLHDFAESKTGYSNRDVFSSGSSSDIFSSSEGSSNQDSYSSEPSSSGGAFASMFGSRDSGSSNIFSENTETENEQEEKKERIEMIPYD